MFVEATWFTGVVATIPMMPHMMDLYRLGKGTYWSTDVVATMPMLAHMWNLD